MPNLARLSHPLRVVFQAGPRAADAMPPASEAPPAPVVQLTLYAADSVAFGCLALTSDRLTDLMNEHAEYEFHDLNLESLDGTRKVSVPTFAVAREELYAVAVAGPRGNPGRRVRTRPTPVEMHLGPYDVSGSLHVTPGADPIAAFHRRRAMIPLTDAMIEFASPDGRRRERFETVLVNRDLTEWIALARGSTERLPQRLPVAVGGGRVRDYTGELRVTES
jgi:hypothetical protein